MTVYQAPVRDLRFVLDELLGVASLTALPRYREFSSDLAASVIDEAARFAQDVLAPINRVGDSSGASFHDGVVQMPAGFRRAYQQYIEGGWTQLAAPSEFGGQGAPLSLAVAVEEIGFGANVAFMLCPLLARGAAEALEAVAARHPLGLGSAADLVGAYSYLAGDASRWTTGSAIVVDGGYAAP